jgi:hypothetical protein
VFRCLCMSLMLVLDSDVGAGFDGRERQRLRTGRKRFKYSTIRNSNSYLASTPMRAVARAKLSQFT